MNDRYSDFDAFVKSQQISTSESAAIDWAEEREKWLRDLGDLYEKIESFLKKYIEAGDIKFEYKPIELSEEDLGTYTAQQMTIKIGRQEIEMLPIGTMLVGMRGCVDILGRAGKSCFMLVGYSAFRQAPTDPEPPKKINWTWKIAAGAPANQSIELTSESLFQVLMNVSGR